MILPFQTVFGIVVAIEGLSVWKGETIDGRSSFAGLEAPVVNNAKHDALCEEVRRHPGSMLALLKLNAAALWLWVKGAARCLLRLAIKALLALYRVSVSVMRGSPFVTVPALSFCYLRQWHCTREDIDIADWVLWFVGVKFVACVCCFLTSKVLASSTEVPASSVDQGSIAKV